MGIGNSGSTLRGSKLEMPAGADIVIGGESLIDEIKALSGLDTAELEALDGATAGTAVASKAVVLDSNKDYTGIRHLSITGNLVTGTTTLSEAELGVLDSVTPGTNAASKAVVAGADGKVGAITFDGAVTSEVDPLTTAGIGAVVATVVATEKGDGVLHKTILTCTATAITFGDEAGQGQYGGTKIYDFPAGLVTVFGAVVDGALTLTAPAIDTWVGDVGLGVEAPTDHQDVAGKTGSVMQKNDIAAAVAKVAQIEAKSVATALTESGARWLDGTGTAKDLFLNVLVDDDALHDNTITGAFTGTVTILWANIGDIA